MKKYLSILIFLFCSTAYAQFGRPTATSREITLVSPLDSLAITKYIWLGIPLDTPHINMSAIRGFLSSQNYLRPIDTNFIHNLASQKMDSTRANLLLAGKQPAGTYLVPGDTSFLHSKIIDTTSLSNRINGKQNVGSYLIPSDTSYLHNHLTDTSSLSNRINGKLGKGDSIYFVTPYDSLLTHNYFLGQLALKQNVGSYLIPSDTLYLHNHLTDTSSLSNRINGKLGKGDSIYFVTPYDFAFDTQLFLRSISLKAKCRKLPDRSEWYGLSENERNIGIL